MENFILTQLSLSEFQSVVKDCIREIVSEQIINRNDDCDSIILNVEDAASFLGVPKSTIYYFTSKGKICHTKRGRRVYFFKKELIKWLNEGRELSIKERLNDVSQYLEEKK